ncbi:hypothetical protein [Thermococcus sp.]|uniref:hypothetical protein n=1 Tax=Thermococcus sp. TaxID=35749 RepID=UPI00262C7E33|nr:hypothetical protein [Thermococcus sp.]
MDTANNEGLSSKDSLLKEMEVTIEQMIANIEWGWETIRIYLTVIGFLLVAYNYLIYQFAIPYIHNVPETNMTKGLIVFASLIIPILSVPLTWATLEIFEYRYRRFLDNAYTANKIRELLGLWGLNLYPKRYYKNKFKGYDKFILDTMKRSHPPTFYTQGKKFIIVLEGIFIFEAIIVVVLLLSL